MIGFADAQLGRGSRMTEALRRHYAHQIEAQPKFRTWMNDLGRKREIEMRRGSDEAVMLGLDPSISRFSNIKILGASPSMTTR